VLPSSTPSTPTRDIDEDSGIFSASDTDNYDSDGNDQDDADSDPSSAWPEVHAAIINTISELGGSVMPKLNWSAPKDATWISATNSMECRTPNEIYLLLKSSDFITHDLEQVFHGCDDDQHSSATIPALSSSGLLAEIPYYLVLRKTIPAYVNSMEFRCFVRRRCLLGICQRDLNHYDFLPTLVPTLQALIQTFYEEKLQNTFPDENFVFDVYIPQPKEKGRVWLIDINPWAQRTDPLLFSWLELLTMPDRTYEKPTHSQGDKARLSTQVYELRDDSSMEDQPDDERGSSGSSDTENIENLPEFRIVKRDDPEAYGFNTPQYGAHKLPKDVVDAGMDGEAGLRDFMGQWRDIMKRQEQQD
jgi:hypothetical protein